MRVNSLREFRKGHVAMARMAGKWTADILWHLDSAAGPGGSEAGDDPEYLAFREWFQARVSEAGLGLVTHVLSVIDVDIRGAVRFDQQPREYVQSFDTAAARIRHLCAEIWDYPPSKGHLSRIGLQQRYKQLFPDEEDDCFRDIKAAHAIDMTDPEQRIEGLRLLGELEKWFNFAQQGMRLFRNDADERARFDEVFQRLVKEADIEKKKVEAVAAGEVGTPDQRAAARDSLLLQKHAIEAEICEYQTALADRRRELETTLRNLSRLGSADSESPSAEPANSAG